MSCSAERARLKGSELLLQDVGERGRVSFAWLRRTTAAHSDVRVEAFGDASSSKAFANQEAKDGQKGHFVSYGLTLIILLVAFGAFVAAGIPLLLGATAVAGTMGLLGPVMWGSIRKRGAEGSALVVVSSGVGMERPRP